MCNGEDLLPESVNAFLDDVDSSLCLPILVVMIFCTAQLIVNHALGIGCTVYQNIQEMQQSGTSYSLDVETGMSLLEKLKGMFGSGFGGIPNIKTETREPPDTHSREEDWDYCYDDAEP